MSSNPSSLRRQCASQPQQDESCAYDWASHPQNPWNWSTAKKSRHMAMLSLAAFTASIGTSIMSAARTQLMEVFEVSNTVALLPLALYVLALGFGPVVAGPLSESFGRHPVYLGTTPLGAAFTLGAGFTHNFGSLCFLRFMAGFCWGPVLATAAGSMSDLFEPRARGPPSAIFILMPFLGPGLGPVVGSHVVVQRGWRWTQWTLLFLAAVSFLLTLVTQETNHEIIQRKMKAPDGRIHEKSASSSKQLREFVTIALLRPLQMLFTEPIVSLTCLYVSAGFGTLFSFFAGVPYSFGLVYGFSLKQSGLVFLSIVIGCLLGLVTVLICDVLLYRKEMAKRAPGPMPPEYRLYPAMFGSLGMPLGLFWFAWTTKSGISWASPAASMISFSWGNLCVFVATTQYVSDTFPAQVVASSASANALARYGFAAAFPLFTIKMYESLGIGWATSLLGFVSLVLVPIPWCFFKFGPTIRSKSRFDAA